MQSILFTFVIFVLAYVKQTVRTGIKCSLSASERERTLDNDPKKKKKREILNISESSAAETTHLCRLTNTRKLKQNTFLKVNVHKSD